MMNIPSYPSQDIDIASDRRITLEHLRVFAAVAQTRSFQAAGLRLGRTQSAITQSIKNLEDCLRCRLLERRQGSVLGLTGDGERVLPDALDVISKVDFLIQAVQRPELKGHIRFGIPPSIGTAELQNALSSCMAVNKGLRVRLYSETSMHLGAMLANGNLDAAIMNESGPDGADDTLIVTHAFPEEPLVWVCNPDALIDREEELPFIAFSEGSPWTQSAVKALQEAGVPHYFAYVSASFESICSAVTAGIGITALPLSNVPETHAVITGTDRPLPPLPNVRTVIKARTKSRIVLDFCNLIARLPVFFPVA